MASHPQNRKDDEGALLSLHFDPDAAVAGKNRARDICAVCKVPFANTRPPVLLKSGHRVHLDCYFALTLRKPMPTPQPN